MKTKKQVEKSIKVLINRGWQEIKKTAKYRVFSHPASSQYNIYVGKLSIRRGPTIKNSWPVSIEGTS